MPVDKARKRALLSQLVKSGRIYQALVFTRTKHGADRLAQQLELDGITAAAIHGNKSQPQRVRALNQFKQNKVAVLVATDIAARGLDIESLPHVVNYELPMVASDYVHRIGRTGRAGTDGDAISLVCVDERPLLAEIEQLLGHRIEVEDVPGFAPDPTIRPQPVQTRVNRGPRPQNQHRAARVAPSPRTNWEQPRSERPQQRWDRRSQGQPSRPAPHARPGQPSRPAAQGSIGRPMSLPGERLSRS